MSLKIRPASMRGNSRNRWLDSRHTFSFADYQDPLQMGFSDLRVLNQDVVQGGFGFPMHHHRDMEIVSWILEGKLRHEDSMGHVSIVGPGGVQRLTAGSGMTHAEFNNDPTLRVHFLQIWILPREKAVAPSYEDKEFSPQALASQFVCIASSDGKDGSTTMDQDASIYVTRLASGSSRSIDLRDGRKAWVHIARGAATLNGSMMAPGDGALLQDEKTLAFTASADAEILVFDLR
jgi:redox-sensitive bicupin YhaK (pirin superfamily)